MSLLEIEDLRVGYGFPVLMGIGFTVEEGETAVIFGLNGAGKTTTVASIAGLLELRREFDLTVVMIEHHVPLVAQVCDYVYCLNFGELLAEGTPDQVRSNPEVIRAYLGQEADEVLEPGVRGVPGVTA